MVEKNKMESSELDCNLRKHSGRTRVSVGLLLQLVYASCAYSLLLPDFKVERANSDIVDTLKKTPEVERFILEDGRVILWASTSDGLHTLYNIDTGDVMLPPSSDSQLPGQKRGIIAGGISKAFIGSPQMTFFAEYLVQIVSPSTTYSMTLSSITNPTTYKVINGFQVPTTSYLVRQIAGSYDKYDYTTKTVIYDYVTINTGETVVQTNLYNPVFIEMNVNSVSTFYAAQGMSNSAYVDLATFLIVRKTPLPTAFQAVNHAALLIDSLEPDMLFADFNDKFIKINTIDGSLIAQYDFTSSWPVASLANVGTLKYMLRLASQTNAGYNGTMFITTKTTPFIVVDMNNTYNIVTTPNQMIYFYNSSIVKNIIAVWPTDPIASYLNMYNFTISACVTRDVAGKCTTCQPGYYFYQVAPNNRCIQKFEFPDMFGAFETGTTIRRCSVNNCGNCIDNYLQCIHCKKDYYWTESFMPYGNCYDKPSIPLGYGINGANFKLEKCKLHRCRECSNNFEECEKCDDGYWYIEVGIKKACYTTTEVPLGAGKKYSQFLLLPCRTDYCGDCVEDYTICKTCAAGMYYVEPGYVKANCFPYDQIPVGYGIGTGFKLEECTVKGCGNCRDDHTKCVGCDVDRWFLEDNDFKQNCYKESDIPVGHGKEAGKYLLVKCSTSNCYSCQQNYKNCDQCTSSFYYIEATGTKTKCMIEADIPSGYGKQLGTYQLKSCNSPGCLDCKSDYTICNPCPGMYYYGDSTAPLGCYNDTLKADGLGKNGASSLLVPCTVTGCKDCWNNYSECLTCNSDRFYTKENGYKSECYLTPDIPLGYGKQASGNLIKTCQMDGCKNCMPNYLGCFECGSGRFYIEPDGDKTGCYLLADIPAGYGQKIGEYQVYACKIPGCKTCFDDYSRCLNCDTGSYFTGAQDDPTGCYTIDTIPALLGKNGTELKLESCTMSTCGNCKEDYTKCVGCPPGQYFIEPNGYVLNCYSKIDIPNGYGIDGDSQVLLPCVDSGCVRCAANYSECEFCEITLYFTENKYRRCFNIQNIPERYGLNGSSRLLTPCENPDCLNCSNNYRNCTGCLKTTYFETMSDNSVVCYQPGKMPALYGNATGMEIKPCQLANCADCLANYAICVACANGTYTLDTTVAKTKCFATNEIPEGVGIAPATQLLKACNRTDCTNCSLDYRKCINCKPDEFYAEEFVDLKDCYPAASIPAGLGKVNSTGKLVIPCKDKGCELCTEDYRTCTKCNSTNYVQKDGGIQECYTQDNIPEFYGLNGANRELVKCSITNCRLCQKDYNKCALCKSGFKTDEQGKCITIVWDPIEGATSYVGSTKGLLNLFYLGSNSTLHVLFDPRVSVQTIESVALNMKIMGYINLTTQETVLFDTSRQTPPVNFIESGFRFDINLGDGGGPFHLLVRDNSNTGYLKESFTIQNLNYTKQIIMTTDDFISQSLVYGIAIVLTYTRMFCNHLGRIFVQSLSTFLDRLCSNWTLIGFTTSKQGTNFDYHVWQTSRFQTYNPWRNSAEQNCLLHNYLLDRNVNCNIFASYGSDIAFIYVSLVFCIAVQIIRKSLKKFPQTKTFAQKFGYLLWMRRVQSLFLQVMIMCLIHLRFTLGSLDWQFIVFCFPILIYYAATFGLTLWRTYVNWSILSSMYLKKKHNPMLPKAKVVVKPLLDYMYEDRKVDSYAAVLHPIIYQIRCCLLAFTTIYLAEKWSTQITLLLVTEVLYMYLTHKADPYTTSIETTLESLSSLQLVVTAVLKLVSNLLDVNDVKQVNIQNAMELISIANYFICTFLTVYMVVTTSKGIIARTTTDKHISNVYDKPVDALDPVIYDMKLETRKANEAVVKENFGRIGHINLNR